MRVMAGEALGAVGPIKMRNPGMLLDVRLAAGAKLSQHVSPDFNGFAYVYDGAGTIGGSPAAPQTTMVLGNDGDTLEAAAGRDSGLRFLLIAGRPIGEPIVQHGPFVMNTQARAAGGGGGRRRRVAAVWSPPEGSPP